MILKCTCGNEFNFGTAENPVEEQQVNGFEFETGISEEHGDYIAIHCLQCDRAIVLTETEEVPDNG